MCNINMYISTVASAYMQNPTNQARISAFAIQMPEAKAALNLQSRHNIIHMHVINGAGFSQLKYKINNSHNSSSI